jgi:hypothetical protein
MAIISFPQKGGSPLRHFVLRAYREFFGTATPLPACSDYLDI